MPVRPDTAVSLYKLCKEVRHSIAGAVTELMTTRSGNNITEKHFKKILYGEERESVAQLLNQTLLEVDDRQLPI
jgi:hypothetical protein